MLEVGECSVPLYSWWFSNWRKLRSGQKRCLKIVYQSGSSSKSTCLTSARLLVQTSVLQKLTNKQTKKPGGILVVVVAWD
jgi:hypothetical protein